MKSFHDIYHTYLLKNALFEKIKLRRQNRLKKSNFKLILIII